MIRPILAVVVSYVVIAVLVTLFCLAGFAALGVDRLFQTDSYEVSTLWLGISLAISAVSAVLGGYVCAVIGGSMRACKALALAVFAFGILFCLPKMREDTNWRAGDVPTLQVMSLAQLPMWMYVVTPVLGAVCVLVGANLKRRS